MLGIIRSGINVAQHELSCSNNWQMLKLLVLKQVPADSMII